MDRTPGAKNLNCTADAPAEPGRLTVDVNCPGDPSGSIAVAGWRPSTRRFPRFQPVQITPCPLRGHKPYSGPILGQLQGPHRGRRARPELPRRQCQRQRSGRRRASSPVAPAPVVLGVRSKVWSKVWSQVRCSRWGGRSRRKTGSGRSRRFRGCVISACDLRSPRRGRPPGQPECRPVTCSRCTRRSHRVRRSNTLRVQSSRCMARRNIWTGSVHRSQRNGANLSGSFLFRAGSPRAETRTAHTLPSMRTVRSAIGRTGLACRPTPPSCDAQAARSRAAPVRTAAPSRVGQVPRRPPSGQRGTGPARFGTFSAGGETQLRRPRRKAEARHEYFVSGFVALADEPAQNAGSCRPGQRPAAWPRPAPVRHLCGSRSAPEERRTAVRQHRAAVIIGP